MKDIIRRFAKWLAYKNNIITLDMTIQTESMIFDVIDGDVKNITFYPKMGWVCIFNKALSKRKKKELYEAKKLPEGVENMVMYKK